MNNSKSRNGGKALIVSPYLDHLGGGERYMLTCAKSLEYLGYSVFYGWDNKESLVSVSHKLGLAINDPMLDPKILPLYHSHSSLAMYQATRGYDLVLYLSDGSIPLLGGANNILHMQVPFHDVGGRNWKNQLKKYCINHVIVNSQFTKKIVDREYGISSKVLYPPVPSLKSKAKSKFILSVGRFESSLNVKKQDVMIKAFCDLSTSLPDWRLKLVGGASEDSWIQQLRDLAEGYPIDLLPNATFEELMSLYAEASIYWHAAGYGVDEIKSPQLLEHFGISTVEAISAHAIPLVYGAGGQTEIIQNQDLLWHSTEELITKTKALTNKQFSDYASSLKIDNYSVEAFSYNLSLLV